MLALLLSESCKQSGISEVESKLNDSLALMERDFPMTLQVLTYDTYNNNHNSYLCRLLWPNMQVITMHLLHHIPEGLSKYGPVYGTWMWQYERFNSWICRRVLNRQHPEATVLETYRVFVALFCCMCTSKHIDIM